MLKCVNVCCYLKMIIKLFGIRCFICYWSFVKFFYVECVVVYWLICMDFIVVSIMFVKDVYGKNGFWYLDVGGV